MMYRGTSWAAIRNSVHLITADGIESWERAPKEEVARRLAERIAGRIGG